MVTRHPEMKLELEIARAARRHQREIAAAFEEARHLHYLRHQALRRAFPIRCNGAMNHTLAAHTHPIFAPV